MHRRAPGRACLAEAAAAVLRLPVPALIPRTFGALGERRPTCKRSSDGSAASGAPCQVPENLIGQDLVDLAMSRDRLGSSAAWIVPDVVSTAVTEQAAAPGLEFGNQLAALHVLR